MKLKASSFIMLDPQNIHDWYFSFTSHKYFINIIPKHFPPLS